MSGVPKPERHPRQPCPRCRKTFRTPNLLLRHAQKCRFGGLNRLKNTAQKSRFNEYLFDSGLERSVYLMLTLRVKAGELRDLKVKPNVFITLAKILVIPDFSAITVKTDRLEFYEAKGFVQEKWLLKMRLWEYYGPGPLHVYVAGHGGPEFKKTYGSGSQIQA